MKLNTPPRITVFSVALLACAAAIAPCALRADTVAWWHFDEKAPGEAFDSASATASMSSTKVIDSCGNAPNGELLVVGGTQVGQWSNKPEVRPAPVLPFVGKKIFDPVSGTTTDNRSALHCTFADSDGGIKAYWGGAVRIPGTNPSTPDPTQPTDAITVECFVCTTNKTVPNTFMPIFGKRRGSGQTSETWALYAQANGKLALRISTDASYIKGYNTNLPLGIYTINDGCWHHVAFTYDKETGVAKVYVDYKLDQTHQLPAGEALTYDKDASNLNYHALWIGGYAYASSSNAGRIFNGSIDELRISDAVLEPGQFLQLVSQDSDDEDVVLHVPFEGDSSIALTDGAVIGGTVGGVQAIYHDTKSATGASAAFDSTEKAGTSVASWICDDLPVADTSSFSFTSANGGANGCFVQALNVTGMFYPDNTTPTTNFNYTVECFAKAAGEGQARRTVLKIGATASSIAAHFITGDGNDNNSHKMEFCCALGANYTWTSLGKSADDFDDGNWHHLALVSDATNKTVKVYFDYKLVATKSNAYLPAPVGFGAYIGSKERGEGQFFDGWVDDVRVMKRALGPAEFLTTHPVGSGTQPLLTALFERNYDFVCAADDYWTVEGTGSARNNGVAPVFQKVSRGTQLLDGTNGTVSAANDYSAYMDRSRIVFPASPFYELDAYTVEFWAKFDGFKDAEGEKAADYSFGGNTHVGVLRFVEGDSTTFDWYLFRQSNNPKSFQVAVKQANGSVAYLTFSLPDRLVADGKWHHYALQFTRNEDNTSGSVLMYADYEPLTYKSGIEPVPQTFAGLYAGATAHRLMLCESTSADLNIIGNIDAIRFWKGNPDPSQFLGRANAPFVLVVR